MKNNIKNPLSSLKEICIIKFCFKLVEALEKVEEIGSTHHYKLYMAHYARMFIWFCEEFLGWFICARVWW